MKIYLVFVVALIIGSVFYESHMTEYFKPSVESLMATTEVRGKIYFVYKRHANSLVPTINNISLDCSLYFGGSAGKCPDSIARLPPGTEVTVLIASVSSTYYMRSIPMSMKVQGDQIYSITPQQFIQDYLRRSRHSLPLFPFMLFVFLILMPLVTEEFRNSLSGVFRS